MSTSRLGAALLAAALLTSPLTSLAEAPTPLSSGIYDQLLPLEGGSNFRDLGGYRTSDQRHVKRGQLFRSGAMSSLTERDIGYLDELGIRTVVDLRSNEERDLFPNRWARTSRLNQVSHDYSITSLIGQRDSSEVPSMARMYEEMVIGLKPQLQLYFKALLAGDGPVVVNCSAGQDRTGITSALALSALGVPRETVMVDYLLSTQFRDVTNEVGSVDLKAAADTNAFAKMMLRYSDGERRARPNPLVTADGVPLLGFALDRIERDYGSVENYLAREIGVGPAEIAQLKQRYLE
jgi:protein-tyrosine phosphatase